MQAYERALQTLVAACELLPVFEPPLCRDPGAGYVRNRKVAVSAGLPCLHRERERGDLRTARVELKSKEVVAEHGVSCFSCGQPLSLHPHLPEHLEGDHEEVPGAAARIHHGHLGHCVGPAWEAAGGGLALVVEAEVLPVLHERAPWMTCGPPGSERVLEQEADHVVLREELC